MFQFEIQARDPASRARAGLITTAHGTVETPVFMPVGTRGSIKSLTPGEVRDHGARGDTLWSHGRLLEQDADAIVAEVRVFEETGRLVWEALGLRCQAVAKKAHEE